jgi:hypothetical protein
MASTTTIYTNVLKELQQNSASETYVNMAIHWINKAMRIIEQRIPNAEFLQRSETYLTTVADQPTYPLPADFFELRSLRDDTNNNVISPVTREQFERNHPDPSSESTGKPYEYTLEFDRTEKKHVLRFSLIPDDEYKLYMVWMAWHPTLSESQNPIFDRIEDVLENGAVYFGARIFWKEPEYKQIRDEYKRDFDESLLGLQALCMRQKPRPAQIPLVLRNS